ncbi:MAG TPA: Asp-tRNA(Asn)/Glu-tRNA(Gln) amidotransferase subunit GatC [Longimicrobiaceae bacterium]|nr:Asp-tRNA(Asn)/Glu-tRNA(Gln) amidotransferase subunit GatC [Longimicrobiaceae bacterium]
MSLTRGEVEQVARLARLSLEEEEVAGLTRDLGSILEHMRELAEADLEGVPPTGGMGEHPAPMRADEPGADPLAIELSELAPRFEESFFLVPRLAALDAEALAEDRTP